jgi:PAS domain S-box-containing protein
MGDIGRSRVPTPCASIQNERSAPHPPGIPSESVLQNFYDSAPFMMGVVELRGDDAFMIKVNQATANMLGADSPDQLENRSSIDAGVSKKIVDLWIHHYHLAAKAQQPVHFEYERDVPDSDNRPGNRKGRKKILSVTVIPTVSPNPEYPRFCYVSQDVTDSRLAAQALADSEERLKNALEATNEGVWEWNITSRIVTLSPRCYQQLGLGLGDIANTFEGWADRCHPDDKERIVRQVHAHLAGQASNFEGECRLRRKDGHYVWLLLRGKTVKRDSFGHPTLLTGTSLDISERKRVEAELKRAKEEAQAASAAKSAFLANISHEIRTPMTAILGYADLLQDDSLSPEQREKFIDTIRRSGRHLLVLINDILDLSKIEADKVLVESLECDPMLIVSEVTVLMEGRARSRGLAFTVNSAPSLPRNILTDPTRTRQILMNLLDNAIKFTRAGAVEFHIRLDRRSNGPSRLCFDILDTGIGMTPDTLSRLFQPFAQADNSTTRRFGGTGLGLTISRRLARMLGGDIDVSSELNRGSRFTFWLPMSENADHTPIPPPPADLQPQNGHPSPQHRAVAGARILLVEDGVDLQILIQHMLAKAGATVDVASDGEEGVVLARNALAQRRPYQLILMDVQMPRMDGYAATRLLRAHGVEAPILALTADAMETNRQASRAAGCDDFFPKPIESDKLLQVVRRLLSLQHPDRKRINSNSRL